MCQLQKQILLSKKVLCMKELNTPTENVGISLFQREICYNIKELYMRE